MTEVRVFDLEDALERVGDDAELLVELFDMFMEDCDSNLALIRQGVASKDQEIIERTAHSMKSAVGNLGGMKAHAAAYAVECAGREGNEEVYQSVVDVFDSEIQAFKQAFEQYRKSV
ncbi:MAG: Hpt domain-containing protein [Bdellovibrionales bacterium]|nr:Hpt domain-containing protein [Bdellovibrionales bacterium]